MHDLYDSVLGFVIFWILAKFTKGWKRPPTTK